ncbi:MAG: hypothetical protein JXB04_07675 [Kiritimatiellae bacterium]|nr:hypothetical protein [Kiritimatiellia bacterium]
MAGILLDLVDFATFGPAGLVLGLPLGALTGWILSGMLGWPLKHRWVGALLAGLYCTMPGTSFIPLGTLCGALSRFFEFPRPQPTDGDGGSP